MFDLDTVVVVFIILYFFYVPLKNYIVFIFQERIKDLKNEVLNNKKYNKESIDRCCDFIDAIAMDLSVTTIWRLWFFSRKMYSDSNVKNQVEQSVKEIIPDKILQKLGIELILFVFIRSLFLWCISPIVIIGAMILYFKEILFSRLKSFILSFILFKQESLKQS